MKINLLYLFVVSRIVLSVWDEAIGTGIRTVFLVARMWLCCGAQDWILRVQELRHSDAGRGSAKSADVWE